MTSARAMQIRTILIDMATEHEERSLELHSGPDVQGERLATVLARARALREAADLIERQWEGMQ